MILLYVFNYLDRINVSFAKLQMNKDLGFDDAVYGLGASVFFIGYFIFELPSNLIMERLGARLWLARIVISWGIVSAAMVTVKTATSFYLLRFLLGVAEAGLFPGVILYLTYWIPAKQRTRVTALFLTSAAIAGVIGGPIAGPLMQISALNLRGWQWLFLIEGMATVFVGLLMLVVLPDRPAKARWLSSDERRALVESIEAEKASQHPRADSLRFAFTNFDVWSLAVLYGCIVFGFYGLGYWTPSIIKQVSRASTVAVGWLSAIPFAAAVVGMLIIGQLTDAKRSPLRIAAISLFVGSIGMFLCAFCSSTVETVFSLSVAAIGIYGALAPFWTVPPGLLRGAAAAAGIAIINSIGNLGGGLIGPNIMGQLRERSNSYSSGLLINAGVVLTAAILSILLSNIRSRKTAQTAENRIGHDDPQ